MKVPIMRSKRFYFFLRLVAFFCFMATPTLNAADPFVLENNPMNAAPTPAYETKQLWNLQNADIDAVIEAVSKVTGKNFIIDPRVQGKITIISSEPIGNNEVYRVFLSALQILGYVAVPTGNMIKIVPDINSKSLNSPIVTNANPGVGDELVVRILKLRNTSATQILPAIQPLLPENSSVTVYQPANTLILSGRAASINRVVQIAQNLDQGTSSQTQIYPLHFANASKIVSLLNSLQSADRAAGKASNVSFAADEQSNSIIISGSVHDQMRLLALINRLDLPPANEAGGTQVIHLNYLKAEKLAPILARVSHSAYLGVVSEGQAPKRFTTYPQNVTNINNTQATAPGASVSEGTEEGSKVSIAAETSTNSIIISAPANTMRTLKAVIYDLDVRPAQVLVEAVIATVGENVLNQLGVEWSFNNNVQPTITTNTNNTTSTTGVTGQTVPQFQTGVGIIQKGDLQAIIHFLMQNTTSDILATPAIVVLNNQKATISDGQNVAIQTTSVPQSTTSQTPFNTFDRQNVVLELHVTPQISPNNSVQLLIDQNDNTISGPVSNFTPTSAFNVSKINTTVMVNSGDILVLGGLINQDTETDTKKVPLLGDIPLIGKYVFSFNTTTVQKKDLMIFIRPIILNNPISNYDVTSVRYNFIRDQQLRRQRGENLITDTNEIARLSPAFTPKVKLPPPFPSPFEKPWTLPNEPKSYPP
ncbi:MAG: type II secretion system secretin GspD [Gammaproteobacteria bacterium]